MTADKRKVSTDALETLGTIIDEYQHRDAIHLAVEPVVAGEWLEPGDDVGLFEGKAFRNKSVKKLGIVDPFIKTSVQPGARFWLVVYPRQITSLRHVWSHPDFAEEVGVEPKESPSMTWMWDFASKYGKDAAYFIDGATDFLDSGRRICDGGLFEGESVPKEFWTHYTKITGRKTEFENEYDGQFFSCSC